MISANAYLGAFPIASALDAGADVVITGRCVDSALTLGPLIHEFGWRADNYDVLSAGTLAGHIIECGAQATGGNFPDWRAVADGWDDMGYPIAECSPDGRFTITKPEGTGGLVSRLTVGEQVLYEVADPASYTVPDVICDWSGVTLTERGLNRVEVGGAAGRPPTRDHKVTSTFADGYRATATTTITGFDAVEKGRAYAHALLKRTRRLFADRGLGDYRDTAVHLIGAQTSGVPMLMKPEPWPARSWSASMFATMTSRRSRSSRRKRRCRAVDDHRALSGRRVRKAQADAGRRAVRIPDRQG